MAKSASSMAELERIIMADVVKAMELARKDMKTDMLVETYGYYTKGAPKEYKRTGALGDTPETTHIDVSSNSASFDAYLDTRHQYSTGDNPNMQQVLELANSGIPWTTKGGRPARKTLGKKGFWERAVKKMDKTLTRNMRKFFKKI